MDNLKPIKEQSTDFAPLYSSVWKDHIFVAPLTAKEMIDKKK